MSTQLAITAPRIFLSIRQHLRRDGHPAPQSPCRPGEVAPRTEVRKQLEQITRVVRRALHKEPGASLLTQRIHAVARRLRGRDWNGQQDDQETLVRQVARVICASFGRRE